MSDNPQDLQEQIRHHERRIEELRQLLPGPAKIDLSSSLFRSTAPQVLNATYSIRHSLAVLQEAITREEQQHLFAAVRRAASKIEALTRPLLELATREVSRPAGQMRPYSLDTLLKESVLYVRSYLGEFDPVTVESICRCKDLIVHCEPSRVRDMIAHTTMFLALSLKSGRLRITLDTDGAGATRKIQWGVSYSDFELRSQQMSLADLECPGYDSTGERALARSFVLAQAESIGGTVKPLDVPPGILLEHEVSVLHDVPPISQKLLNSRWTEKPVIICDEPPDSFLIIDAELVAVSDDDDLPTVREELDASLLVLHHLERSPPTIIANNIRRAHKAELPVLLRASTLDYQEYLDYRNTVDAILLEPCDKEMLARYVIGLSQHDRRTGHRQAQLH